MQNLYASGIETNRTHMTILDSHVKSKDDNSYKIRGGDTFPPPLSKPALIPYDYHSEVHQQAHDFVMNVTSHENMVHFFVCHQKKQCLQEFMKAKSRHLGAQEDQYKFQLKNSIIPAI